MKRRLLLMALATTMVFSMLTGCGSNKDTSEETTTPATNVEQDSNDGSSNVDTPTKEDTKKEPIFDLNPSYDEKFYELDMEALEEKYNEYVEDLGKEIADEWKAEQIRGYEVMKYVFEDMTQKFKNKEEVTVTDSIDLISIPEDYEGTSFVCDVTKIVSEDDERAIYKEFGGFNAKKTEFNDVLDKKGYIVVELNANAIEGEGSPMWISVFVTINEDRTYSYKEINIQYML